jgi:Putative peptidoglycan binding domain
VPDHLNTLGRGPLGTPTNSPISDPGTSALVQHRPSVPVGTEFPMSEGSGRAHPRIGGNRGRGVGIPQLQLGTRGSFVQRLQRLLNSRLHENTALKVDGIFGPKTRAAVLKFQKSAKLKTDGIVGKDTWFNLLAAPTDGAGPKTSGPELKTPSVPVSSPISSLAKEKPVDEWSMEERFEYVLKHTGAHLGPDLRAQFNALLTPVNIGIMVGCLVVWAAGHFCGVSELTDAFLLGFGLVFMGKAAIDAARYLKNFVELTCTASSKDELEDAANDLAQAIAIIGVVAFFSLLAKVARAIGEASKTAEKVAAAPVEEEAPAASGKAQPKTSKGSSAADEPKKPAPPDPIAAKLEGSEFNGVKADRVRPGTNGKVAVIGRSMSNAVEPYGKGAQGAGYNVETFSGDKISPEALEEWSNLKKEYAPNPIPEDVVKQTQLFEENEAWANKLANQGYTVVDVDNPGGQAASPFYEMEKTTLFGN